MLEWNENFVQDHPSCMFGKLEVFCKWFRTLKNDEEVYMQLRNIQWQIVECVEVYYEQLFKLANCLYVKAMDFFKPLFFKYVCDHICIWQLQV
jgi:hypothetical protein